MFIKRTKLKEKEYIQITKTYRQGKKVKHKVILNLGRSDKVNTNEIVELINALQKIAKEFNENGK